MRPGVRGTPAGGARPAPAGRPGTASRLRARAARHAAESAERSFDAGEGFEWDERSSEADDAPTPDELPEWFADDDDRLVDADAELPWENPAPAHLARARVAIFQRADGELDHEVFVQATGDPAIDRSLEEHYEKWDTVAGNLIAAHPEALRERTLLGAFRQLRAVHMHQIEVSTAQGSHDRFDLVRTGFGIVPLWFFGLGGPRVRNHDLFRDLEALGGIARRDGLTRLSGGVIRKALPDARASADTLRKHGPAILAVLAQPEVVARHRELWPATTLDALNRDLGREGAQPTSEEVLALALFGAFEEGS